MSHDHSMDARGEDSAPSGRQRLDDGDLMSLPPSTVLDGRYEITALLGSGGFSIVYEARDLHAGGQTVALKEFFPSQICIRIGSHTVSLRSQREQAVFEQGLRAFLHEARLLRNLDHVGIVRVHNWFEANGTAYIVMKRLRGETLLQRLAANRLPDETTLRTWLGRILSSLELLHEHGVLHRDINPSNIFLTEPDDPVLIDFGAARQCIGKVSQSLNQIASAGYSPLEQYDEAGLEEQKPPTDIYALGATLYHVVTRTRPAASTSRAPRDRLRPAAEIAAGRYSPAFLGSIDRAMAMEMEKRWPSCHDWAEALGLSKGPEGQTASEQKPQDQGSTWQDGPWPLRLALAVAALAVSAALYLGKTYYEAEEAQKALIAEKTTADQALVETKRLLEEEREAAKDIADKTAAAARDREKVAGLLDGQAWRIASEGVTDFLESAEVTMTIEGGRIDMAGISFSLDLSRSDTSKQFQAVRSGKSFGLFYTIKNQRNGREIKSYPACCWTVDTPERVQDFEDGDKQSIKGAFPCSVDDVLDDQCTLGVYIIANGWSTGEGMEINLSTQINR